jgi:hypothetical protein
MSGGTPMKELLRRLSLLLAIMLAICMMRSAFAYEGASLDRHDQEFIRNQLSLTHEHIQAAASAGFMDEDTVVKQEAERILNESLDRATDKIFFLDVLGYVEMDVLKDRVQNEYFPDHHSEREMVGPFSRHFKPTGSRVTDVDWQWIWMKYKESFQYGENLNRLIVGIKRVWAGACSGDRSSYVSADEIIGGVIGWAIGTGVGIAIDKTTLLATFVLGPGGYILGDYIGMKVGEWWWDKSCAQGFTKPMLASFGTPFLVRY